MILGIDPKIDFAFKWVFGNPRNSALLIHFLNAVLDPDVTVSSVEILNPFNEKSSNDDKLSILDVKARDQDGRLFNIEIQLLLPSAFTARVLYYWADLYRSQLTEGDDYDELAETISIVLIDQVLFRETPDWHLKFELRDVQHGIRFSNLLQIHVIEFPRFLKAVDNLSGPLEQWVYLLRNAEQMDPGHLPESLDQTVYAIAMQEWNMLTQNDLERERYNARVKLARDERGLLKAAMEEGLKKGRLEGEAKGQLIGRIRVFEELLGHAVSSDDQLAQLSPAELQQQAERLAEQLRQRQN
jgi:predicted transposase/invertase (TIGR01784 family)